MTWSIEAWGILDSAFRRLSKIGFSGANQAHNLRISQAGSLSEEFPKLDVSRALKSGSLGSLQDLMFQLVSEDGNVRCLKGSLGSVVQVSILSKAQCLKTL